MADSPKRTRGPARHDTAKALAVASGIVDADRTLGEFVDAVLTELGLSAAALATKLRITPGAVSQWRSGDASARPSVANVKAMVALVREHRGESPAPLHAPESNPEVANWLENNPAVAAEIGADGRAWLLSNRFVGGHAAYQQIPELVAEYRRDKELVQKLRILLRSRHGPHLIHLIESLYATIVAS